MPPCDAHAGLPGLSVLKAHLEANGYEIEIAGLNVIKNLPEETTEDIYEAVHNLRFLRFSLRKG